MPTWTGSETFASFDSVVAMWHHRLKATPESAALYGTRSGSWYTLSWSQCGARTQAIASGLRSLGVQRGDRCGLLCSTRPEWILIDLGILSAGAATTTLFPTSPRGELGYILRDAGVRVLFVESPDLLDKVRGLDLPDLEHVVLVEGRADDAMKLDDLERQGVKADQAEPDAFRERAAQVGPDDLATLLYTSGTTGPPKGVELTHDNWVFEAEAMDRLGLLSPVDRHFLFLPLAHAFAKVLELAVVRTGVPTAVVGDPNDMGAHLLAYRPTVMAAVPRVFEKIRARAISELGRGGVKANVFDRAMDVGRQVSALRRDGKKPGRVLRTRYAMFDKLVFSRIRQGLGGRMRLLVSGGAPLDPEVAEFFHAAGLLILEGYGLTESSAASFVNRPGRFRFGTVGLPLDGVRVQIADDGEILLAGRGVMRGYWQDPDATAAVLQDGWLHTGDVGSLDDQGFLTITDRKKDLIVTASGKNVAPLDIEARIQARSELVGHVVMQGDKRPYCTALIALDPDGARRWASERGIASTSVAELSTLPELQASVWEHVRSVNSELASHERIRRIAVLPRPLQIDQGELTPSGKVRRRPVGERWGDLLDALYDAPAAESPR
jgi:long-chain acyl-CoA synthetase